jgi:hypothetical protein
MKKRKKWEGERKGRGKGGRERKGGGERKGRGKKPEEKEMGR